LRPALSTAFLRGIGGYVGARFVDKAYDAERDANLEDAKAVGTSGAREHLAYGVGKRADDVYAGGHGVDALGSECEAVDHGGRKTGFAGGVEVECVLLCKRGGLAADGFGHELEGAVLLAGRLVGKGGGGAFGAAAEVLDVAFKVGNFGHGSPRQHDSLDDVDGLPGVAGALGFC